MGYRLNKEVFYSRMKSLGFGSLLDFAKQTGIHRNTLKQYLNNKEVFQNAFARMADALQCDPLDLLEKAMDAEALVEDLSEIRPVVNRICEIDQRIAVVLLGSRARGKCHPYADWDIGVTRADPPIDGNLYLELRGEAEDMADDLPRSVDIINLDAAPTWFIDSIDYDPVFLNGSRESYAHFMGVIHGIRKGSAA